MRKALITGLLFAGLVPFAAGAQRGTAAPGGHASAPAAHAMSAAPMVSSHAAPSHIPSSSARQGTHYAGAAARATAPHRTSIRPITNPPAPARHTGTTTVTSNYFIGGYPFNGSPVFGDGYPVPGLGFDFDHFFAVHPGWGRNRFLSGVVLPFVGYGGFYLPVPYYMDEGPQVDVVASEAPAPALTYGDQPGAAANEPAVPPVQSREYSFPAPSKSVSEFIFVKRDGTRIFAVAYSLTKDNLQYITKEGLRRSLSLDSLDYDATEKSNEERGNTINLPRHLVSSDV